MFNFAKLKQQDLLLVVVTALLSVIGLVTVFSSTFYNTLNVSNDFKQQALFFAVGIAVYLLVTSLEPEFVNRPAVQIALTIAIVLLLIGLLLFGARISGTKRWIDIFGFSLQPSEFAKLIVITITATAFATKPQFLIHPPANIYERIKSHRLKDLLANRYLINFCLNAAAVLSIVLLVRAQPSLGNALILFGLWLLMLASLIPNPSSIYAYLLILLGGFNLILNLVSLQPLYDQIHFSFRIGQLDLIWLAITVICCLLATKFLRLRLAIVGIILLVGVCAAFATNTIWNHALTGYQQDRIVSFLHPESDPLGSQWQVTQAKIAIASGQIFGKGLLAGTQSNLGMLPFAYTDFAYAAFAEQFGMVGCFVMLGLLYLLVWRILRIAEQTQDNFGRLVCIGVAIMISLNVIVNVGMNLGIMPVTGVPLPFISYGGSAILLNFVGLGLVQMVHTSQSLAPQAERLISLT